MTAVVTRDVVYPRQQRQTHQTVHAVSPSGVPLLVRQKSNANFPGGTGEAGDGRAPNNQQITSSNLSVPGYGRTGDAGGKGGKFNVLPPIRNTGGRMNEGKFSLSELEDISLKNEVVTRLREIGDRTLQGMLTNMRAQDRDRDGVLSTDHVKGALRKFQVNLSDEGAKNICKKFGENGERLPVVRYEEMMNYLISSRMEALRAPPPLPSQQSSNFQQRPTQPGQQQTQTQPRNTQQKQKVLFSDRDEGKLMVDLQRELSNNPINMADLRRTMYDLDRSRNDFLTGQQVEVAFKKCNVQLTPDVRARLLMATDRTGTGVYRIETLMNYLTRIQPEAHQTLLGNNNHQPRQARVGQLPDYPIPSSWQNQDNDTQRTEYLPDEGFSEGGNDLQSQGQYEQGYGLSSQPQGSYASTPQPQEPYELYPQDSYVAPLATPLDDQSKEAFDVDKWRNDYQYLAQAVYNGDQEQTGYLSQDEVNHVSSTYNLVYNLGISENNIRTALDNSSDSYGVMLENFVSTLYELHLNEVQ